jgi:hypothetical protein
MSLHSINGVAGEDLIVSRVVYSDPTTEGSVEFFMADSTAVEPIGITPEGSQDAPGIGANDVTLACTSGRSIDVRGRGHTVLCRVHTTGVLAGQRVKVAAANGIVGKLVGSETGGEWTVGIALRDALSGELAPVYIDPLQIARPVS